MSAGIFTRHLVDEDRVVSPYPCSMERSCLRPLFHPTQCLGDFPGQVPRAEIDDWRSELLMGNEPIAQWRKLPGGSVCVEPIHDDRFSLQGPELLRTMTEL
jgi:hypothetical protein